MIIWYSHLLGSLADSTLSSTPHSKYTLVDLKNGQENVKKSLEQARCLSFHRNTSIHLITDVFLPIFDFDTVIIKHATSFYFMRPKCGMLNAPVRTIPTLDAFCEVPADLDAIFVHDPLLEIAQPQDKFIVQ